MNSFIILLVISMLFLDVFFSVSNKAIVVVFLAGRVEAGGQQEGVANSSQELSFEKSSTPEALGKVQEVSSSVISYGRGRAAIVLGRQAMEEGRQQLGRMTNVKVQVHEVA